MMSPRLPYRLALAFVLAGSVSCGLPVAAEHPDRAIAFRPILGDFETFDFSRPGPWIGLGYRDGMLILGEAGGATLDSIDLIPPQDGDSLGWTLEVQVSAMALADMAEASEAVQGQGVAVLLGQRILLTLSLDELGTGDCSLTNLGRREAQRVQALLEGRAFPLTTAITVRPLLDPGVHDADEIVVMGRGGEEYRFGPGPSFRLGDVILSFTTSFGDRRENEPALVFEVHEDQAASFTEWTEAHARSVIGFFFEDELVSGPAEILGSLPSRGLLMGAEGTWTEREAHFLLERLLK